MSDTASVIDLYDSLLAAQDERSRARIIASAFERLEDRYPEIKDMATASGLRETELRLQKEIEQVRADLSKDIEQVRADLSKEIEQVRADLMKEIEQVRADLSKDIEQVRADLSKDIEQLRTDLSKDIEQVRVDLSRDIEQLRAGLSKDIDQVRLRIEEVRSELGQEIARNKHDILRWTTGLLFAQLITILAALIGVSLM